MKQQVIINSQLSFREYLRTNVFLALKTPYVIVFYILTLIMITGVIERAQAGTLFESTNYIGIIFIVYMFIGFPLTCYFSWKKSYKTHLRLSEKVQYIFTENELQVNGESFNSKLELNNFYKITEISNAFLFYESKLLAIIIPKVFINDEEDLAFIRSLKKKK